MLIEDKIEIHAPQDRVWQVTVDVENWPKWSPVMETIKREDTGEFKLGSTAFIKQKQMPETRWTVNEMDMGNSFTWQGRTLGIDMTATHIITPGESAVTSLLRIEMEGLLITLFGPLMKVLVGKSLKEENQGLKQFCETNEGSTMKPFMDVYEAIQYINGYHGAPENFILSISDEINDSIGINMAIITDGILAKGWTPNGFEQRNGFRNYFYKNIE